LVGDTDDIEPEPIDLTRILEEELDKARNTHTVAEFTLEGTLPAMTVEANMMVSSVFRNLFNNAVQHNDSPTPRVVLSAVIEEGVARISVADNGPGVPDPKEDIFGKGERGLESDGTGIGLYLVETLVTEFGGRVWVDDNEPTGAVFTVELPLA